MKKEDAKMVLEFLEYVGKNMAVKDENFEYHTNMLFDCKLILEDEVNEAETSRDKALNLADVSGSLPTINQCLDKIDELGDSFVDRDDTGEEIWDGFAISNEDVVKLVRFAQGNDR